MNIILTIFNIFHTRNHIHGFRVRINNINTAILITAFLLITFPTITFADKTYNVVLVTSSNSGPYLTTANNIEASITTDKASLVSTNSITVEELYSQKESLPKKTDLFIPIGRRALKETLKYSDSTPVLATLVSQYDFDAIISMEINLNNTNIGAIFIDQQLKRHLSFAKLVLPNSSNYGFVISSGNKRTLDKLSSLNSESHHIEILDHGENVISTLSHVLDEADVLIALPDPIVFNLRTTRNILLSTYRKRIPVIGFSNSYVKAGALAAIYSTPELIGKQTGEFITDLAVKSSLNNKSLSLPRLNSKYFTISVNNRVSRSLGLPTLDADSLRKSLFLIEAGNDE